MKTLIASMSVLLLSQVCFAQKSEYHLMTYGYDNSDEVQDYAPLRFKVDKHGVEIERYWELSGDQGSGSGWARIDQDNYDRDSLPILSADAETKTISVTIKDKTIQCPFKNSKKLPVACVLELGSWDIPGKETIRTRSPHYIRDVKLIVFTKD